MNERIKELVVESGNGQMRDGRLYPHIGIRFEEDWQRFAELIVRECIGVIGDENYTMLTGKAYCTQLKRHFGVEE